MNKYEKIAYRKSLAHTPAYRLVYEFKHTHYRKFTIEKKFCFLPTIVDGRFLWFGYCFVLKGFRSMNPFEDNYNRCEYKEKCNIIIRSKDISTLNLYTKCPYCKGRGLRGGETNTVNCGSCNGTGKLNTDLGYQILYK